MKHSYNERFQPFVIPQEFYISINIELAGKKKPLSSI